MQILRVIDFETTGFPPNAGVIEVGWTDVFIDQVVSMEPKWHAELCNPYMPIETGAKEVHHITEEDIQDCRHPNEVLAELLTCDYFVAHHSKFESHFFRPEKIPYICTLKGAQTFILDAPKHTNQFLRYHLGFDNDPKFDKAMSMPPHRAGPDTYVTAWLLMDLLKRASIEQLLEVTDKPTILGTVSFGKHQGKSWSQVPSDYMAWLLSQPNVKEDVEATCKYYLNERRQRVQGNVANG